MKTSIGKLNDELLSKTISCLRFPLMVGIVFIHSNLSTFTVAGIDYGAGFPQWYYQIIAFFSNVLPRVGVPLYFFFSGYLFFRNAEFNLETYKRKLKNRVHSLLVPYIAWNLIGYGVYSIRHFLRVVGVFPPKEGDVYNLNTFIHNLVYPMNFPLWFMLSLMAMCLLAPLVYRVVAKGRLAAVVVLALCWFFDPLHKDTGFGVAVVFFFTLGAYFSVCKVDIVPFLRKMLPVVPLYFVVAIADALTREASYNIYIHNIGIVLGMVSALSVVAHWVEKGVVSDSKFLADASFFLFVSHGILMATYASGIIVLVQPRSPYAMLFVYFFIPITLILFSLWLYKQLSLRFPKIMGVIMGGRN